MKATGVMFARITLPALLAVAIMSAGERIVGTAPVKSAFAPTGIVWADRVFTSKGAFDRWLQARGSDYGTWAIRHPSAAAEAEQKEVPAEVRAVSAGPATSTRSVNMVFLTLALGGFVALSLALALALRHVRIAVMRPALTPALARAGAVFATGAAVAVEATAGGVGGSVLRRRHRPPKRDSESAPPEVANEAHSVEPARAETPPPEPSARPRPAARRPHDMPRSALVVAKTARRGIAMFARTGDPDQPPVPRHIRFRFWVIRMHYRHPELAWYLVACTFAAAAGALFPLLAR